jgi:hypothetical protein
MSIAPKAAKVSATAEPLGDGGDHRSHLVELCHIGLHRKRPPARRANILGDARGRRLIVEPVDRHIGAGSRQLACDCRADPLLRPGHQRGPAGQLHLAPPVRCTAHYAPKAVAVPAIWRYACSVTPALATNEWRRAISFRAPYLP